MRDALSRYDQSGLLSRLARLSALEPKEVVNLAGKYEIKRQCLLKETSRRATSRIAFGSAECMFDEI